MDATSELLAITERVIARSQPTREAYLDGIKRAGEKGPRRAHLSCSNQAHAYAAAGEDQNALATKRAPNIGIITAYNDMLSAHQ
ncbi:MAG TPA: phosphogluconate dehydratase, partial [Armatimonadetes bacterium]|nr:phosphogluconate dehydratase [Armatimonadota bacterium]